MGWIMLGIIGGLAIFASVMLMAIGMAS